MATKLDGDLIVTYLDLPHTLNRWSSEITLETKTIISPLPLVPMATKLARLVIYPEGLLSIKSHDAVITRFCKITRQTKTNISHNHSVFSQQAW